MHDLIGRDDTIVQLSSLTESHPLVTVVGPGGVGKTSVVQAVVADRPHLFIELSSFTTSDGLSELAAQRAGFGELEELVEWMVGSPITLVLDTCEHVLDGAADLATTVIDRVPDAHVVATSRVPLVSPDEVVHVLPTLDVDTGASSPAVELFLERARRAGAPESIQEQTAAIARLCVRLDGLPLAIELAAARARSMSPDEMVQHLDDDGVEVLHRPRYRGEARHRSLRAAIDWSVQLLDDESRSLFEQLSVFPAWFDASLVHGMAGTGSLLNTSDLLAGLVERSLVRAEIDDGSRFALLDSTRAYAEQLLTESGRAEQVRDAYVDAVCDCTNVFIETRTGDWTSTSFGTLLGLADDIVGAARLALGDDTLDRAFHLITVLWGVVPMARSAEIADLAAAALERWPASTTPGWADVAATRATALREVGRHDEALHIATEALDHVDGGVRASVTVPRIVALLLWRDDPDDAARHAEAAGRAAADIGLEAFEREMRVFLAQLDAARGNNEQAITAARQALAETGPDDLNHLFALLVEGMAQLTIEPDAAIDTLRLAHRLSERAGYIFGSGASLRLLALRELQLGHHDAAATSVLALMEHAQDMRNLGEQGMALMIGTAILRATDAAAADAVVAAAAGWRHHAALASGVIDELSVPDSNVGRSIAPSVALGRCRDALTSLVEHRSSSVVEATASDPPSSPGSTDAAELLRTGDHWTASFAGRRVTLQHTKGLADIAALLARPGSELHILDLAGVSVVESSADDVLDARAMDAYRDRIRNLQEDLADADDMGDLGRSERAQAELDALVDQLTAATGLGGRSRRTTGTAERARSTVTKRVRATIKKIGAVHPALGRHLQASISTGVFCSYDPEHPVDWRL